MPETSGINHSRRLQSARNTGWGKSEIGTESCQMKRDFVSALSACGHDRD